MDMIWLYLSGNKVCSVHISSSFLFKSHITVDVASLFLLFILLSSLSVSFICNHCHRFSFAARKSFCIVTTKGDHLYLDAIQKISIFVYMTWTTANGKIFSVHWICYVVPHSHTSSNGERITKQIAARREKNTHSKFISRLRTHN